MTESLYAKEIRVCDDMINRIQVTAVDILPGKQFFVRGLIWRDCEACVQAEGGHFEPLLWQVQLSQCTKQFPPRDQELLE
jgi:hypothetical protein